MLNLNNFYHAAARPAESSPGCHLPQIQHDPEGLRGKDQAEQSPWTLRLQDGDIVSLNCTYPVSSFRALWWFRQGPSRGPKLLFPLYSMGEEKQQERLRLREVLCIPQPPNLKTQLLSLHCGDPAPKPWALE
ncbi:T cell receptor alpha variable 20 [Manis javanica]|nr:T cell receptor alpha variable 20 [Manis javanica]